MVLNQIETKQLDIQKAATLMELLERQIWRLLAGYRREGVAAVAYGNRGRKPANTLEERVKLKVWGKKQVLPKVLSERWQLHLPYTP